MAGVSKGTPGPGRASAPAPRGCWKWRAVGEGLVDEATGSASGSTGLGSYLEWPWGRWWSGPRSAAAAAGCLPGRW